MCLSRVLTNPHWLTLLCLGFPSWFITTVRELLKIQWNEFNMLHLRLMGLQQAERAPPVLVQIQNSDYTSGVLSQ